MTADRTRSSGAQQKRLERILILRTIINAGGHLDAKAIADRASTECDHDALDGLPPIGRRGAGQKLQAMQKAGLVVGSQDIKFEPLQWYATKEGEALAHSLGDDGDRRERRPPDIVEASDDPECALTAFIAQELEHWGFGVSLPAKNPASDFNVMAGEQELQVVVWRVCDA